MKWISNVNGFKKTLKLLFLEILWYLCFRQPLFGFVFPGMRYLPGSCSLEMKDKIFESYLKNVMLNS